MFRYTGNIISAFTINMPTYYLDTTSGFFYKINLANTCSIEAWSSTGSLSGIIPNTIVLNTINYTVTKITSISKISSEFPGSGNTVKNTGGVTLSSSGAYTVSPFTGTTLAIPVVVTSIDSGSFSACTSLTSIIYSRPLTSSAVGSTGTSPLIQQYTNLENKIIIKKYFQRGSMETTFKSGDYPTVNIISEKAFIDNDKLYKIIINSNVIITQNAFFNCLNLKGIVISSPCTLQNSIISSTSTKLDYVLISSTSPVTMDTTNVPTTSTPVFPSSILASSNYCVVSKENSAFVDTLFGTLTKVHIEDATNPPATDTPMRVYIRPATYNSIKIALVGESNDIASIKTSIDFDNKVDTDNAKASADAEKAQSDARTAALTASTPLNSANARTAALTASTQINSANTRTAALTASAQINSANANTIEQEAKLLRAIQAKVRAIDAAITDITGEQAINNRKINYFGQDKYVNMYVNRIGLILYYIVFILLALSFYYNRESYSIVMIVISLIVFALLPFVIKYITRFAYEQFLGLLKVFYKGNALYLDPYTIE